MRTTRDKLSSFLTSTLDHDRWKNISLLLEHCRQEGFFTIIPGLEFEANYISVVQSIILYYYPGRHDIVHCVLKVILRHILTKFANIPDEVIDSILNFLSTSEIKDLKEAFPLEFLSPIIDNRVKHRNVNRLIALLYLRDDIDITAVDVGDYTIIQREVELRAGRFEYYYDINNISKSF